MPDPATPGRPKVLVVEDDRETREMLALTLEVEGFDVAHIPNGIKLVSAIEVDRPDVILCDVLMSWIDGIELCRALKRNPVFGRVPVVFISGLKRPDDVRRGMEAGAVDYFAKPIDMVRLIERLRDLTNHPAKVS